MCISYSGLSPIYSLFMYSVIDPSPFALSGVANPQCSHIHPQDKNPPSPFETHLVGSTSRVKTAASAIHLFAHHQQTPVIPSSFPNTRATASHKTPQWTTPPARESSPSHAHIVDPSLRHKSYPPKRHAIDAIPSHHTSVHGLVLSRWRFWGHW